VNINIKLIILIITLMIIFMFVLITVPLIIRLIVTMIVFLFFHTFYLMFSFPHTRNTLHTHTHTYTHTISLSLSHTHTGLVDVYYHSTKNRKFRSRVEAAISLGTCACTSTKHILINTRYLFSAHNYRYRIYFTYTTHVLRKICST
jgi:hypothetical protein